MAKRAGGANGPLTTTNSLSSRRSTRSSTKETREAIGSASGEPGKNPSHTKAPSKRKRAATTLSEKERPTASKKKSHIPELPGPVSKSGSDEEAPQPEAENTQVPWTARTAPARPKLSSSLGSENEHPEDDFPSEAEDSEGLISSDAESVTPTTKQMFAERPLPVNPLEAGTSHEDPPICRPSRKGKVKDKTKQVPNKVASTEQSHPLIGENDQDATPDTLLASIPPAIPTTIDTQTNTPPDPILVPGPVVGPPPWLDATNLVFTEEGRLLQSRQSPEVDKCISKTIRLASLKVFFINAFPDISTQYDWLRQCLVDVLQDQAPKDRIVHQINLRAQQDNQYFLALISMMSGKSSRWSNARQLTIEHARKLLDSDDCTYGIKGLEVGAKVTKVADLLHEETFHFALKANSNAANKAAPYQHPEVFASLSHFFKGRSSYGAEYTPQLHQGVYGLEMPQPFIALIATSIQMALGEWRTGTQRKRAFTENNYRNIYRGHMDAMDKVRSSEKGNTKYARMVSSIYAQTMKHINCGDAATSAPVKDKKQIIDVDAMEE